MKYRIAAVSYVNTLPFLYGLSRPEIQEMFDVMPAHPARCAELLERGEVDVALCPVGALPALGQYHVITDYCIGCDGPVRTVSIYSHKPLHELTQIVLSAESRTSNLLVQLLNSEYWKHNIQFLPALELVERPAPELVEGPVSPGSLCIGDICFEKEKEYPYRTDLGHAWKEWTGLPFAFACWVSKEKIDDAVVEVLNTAFADGIRNIDVLQFPSHLDAEVLRAYLRKNISFGFDAGKQEAMKKFLALI